MTHSYATAIRTQHLAASIRGPVAAADVPPAASRLTGPTTYPVTAMRTRRDGAARSATVASLDRQNRIFVGKPARGLGWDPRTALRLVVAGQSATVEPGAVASPRHHRVRLDNEGRCTLPPAAVAALDVAPGEQVLAVAVLPTGVLHLHAVADAAQALTGWVDPSADTPAPGAAPSRRTGVRRRFAPDPDAGTHPPVGATSCPEAEGASRR